MDIADLLIKDSFDYILQADVITGEIQRIGGEAPTNLVFVSGLTINKSFIYNDGTQRLGYVLTTDDTGKAKWAPISGSTYGTSGTSGTSGSSGANGSSGINGNDGVNGSAGSSGISGTSGINGSSGSSGSSGMSGTSGSSGINGNDGTAGTSGSSGANGSSGSAGTSGTSSNGTAGTSGTSGANGSSGSSGINGTAGSSGTSGSSGLNGSSGSSGTSGTNGTSGSSGSSGSSGTRGSSGSSGSSGMSGTSGSSGSSGISPDITNAKIGVIGVILNGNGGVITTGSKGFIQVPYNCTIVGWTVVADVSGSIVLDVKKCDYSTFPTTTSIAGTNFPTLSSAQKNTDNTLLGWGTTSVNSGDLFEFSVTSVSTITRATAQLLINKT